MARYAIGQLYEPLSRGESTDAAARALTSDGNVERVAGLKPMNFITFATPHLGSRGRNQVSRIWILHSAFFFSPSPSKISEEICQNYQLYSYFWPSAHRSLRSSVGSPPSKWQGNADEGVPGMSYDREMLEEACFEMTACDIALFNGSCPSSAEFLSWRGALPRLRT